MTYLCIRFSEEDRYLDILEGSKLFDLHFAQPLMLASWHSLIRKVGRVIDRAGLEIRYTLFGYRGFESLTFR